MSQVNATGHWGVTAAYLRRLAKIPPLSRLLETFQSELPSFFEITLDLIPKGRCFPFRKQNYFPRWNVGDIDIGGDEMTLIRVEGMAWILQNLAEDRIASSVVENPFLHTPRVAVLSTTSAMCARSCRCSK